MDPILAVGAAFLGFTLTFLVWNRDQPKFEPAGLYPGGAKDTRAALESTLGALAARLIDGLRSHPTKSFVLAEFAVALADVRAPDTEDRERFCTYLEQIMDIVGIESSDGLLNEWMYGFDPNAAA